MTYTGVGELIEGQRTLLTLWPFRTSPYLPPLGESPTEGSSRPEVLCNASRRYECAKVFVARCTTMLVTKCTVRSIDERERWIEQLRQPREPLFILSRLNWVASYKFAFKSNQDFLEPLTSNRSSLLLYPLFLSVFLRHDYDGYIFEQTDVPQRRNIWRSQFAYS